MTNDEATNQKNRLDAFRRVAKTLREISKNFERINAGTGLSEFGPRRRLLRQLC